MLERTTAVHTVQITANTTEMAAQRVAMSALNAAVENLRDRLAEVASKVATTRDVNASRDLVIAKLSQQEKLHARQYRVFLILLVVMLAGAIVAAAIGPWSAL